MDRMPPTSTPQEPALLRVRLDLAYDGTDFHGWASQPGLPTVQGALEEGLERILRRPARTVVAGRTDAGVHARGQVAHLDLTAGEWEALSRGQGDEAGCTALVRRLTAVLKPWRGALTVSGASRPAPGFDARFSALWRRYSYTISDAPGTRDPLNRRSTLWHGAALDVEAMDAAAQSVLGLQEFLSFCKPRDGATTVRELQEFRIRRDPAGLVRAHLRADAFCHHMVRSLVAAALLVGEGREPVEWMRRRLLEQSREGQPALAAPHALVLEEVAYPDDDASPGASAQRAEGTRARRGPQDQERLSASASR